MEIIVTGLIGFICILIVVFIFGGLRKGIGMINKIENKDSKISYLYNEHKHLVGKMDKVWEKEVIEIEVTKPLLPGQDWVVYKLIKNWNPVDTVGDKHEVFRISDEELSDKISK